MGSQVCMYVFMLAGASAGTFVVDLCWLVELPETPGHLEQVYSAETIRS